MIGKITYKNFDNTEDNYSVQIPTHWRLIAVNEYGNIFSDEEKKQGVLTIRSVSALFSKVEKYADDLVLGLVEKNNYELISRSAIKINKRDGVDIVFRATARVNGKEEKAAIILSIIHDAPSARFYLISYSVLEKDMNRYVVIYTNAIESFQIK